MVFAGTGPLGCAEINARTANGVPQILINDRFGTLVTGSWKPDGTAELSPRGRRIEWRDEVIHPRGWTVTVHEPAQLPANKTAIIDVGAATIMAAEQLQKQLGIDRLIDLHVYLYPDPRSKQSLTGNGGAGHAIPSARTLHVLNVPRPDIDGLLHHEATHIIARAAWGAPGSILFGEGLAVWASGRYAGKSLDMWKKDIVRRPIADLLGRGFMQIPEGQSYPLAGLIVEAAVRTVGIAKVRDHLYPASAADWPKACAAAGTTPEALEQALTDLLTK
jgi:hypothetical protein